jgi:hypothetical protein
LLVRAGFALALGASLALATRAGAQTPPPPPVPNPNATPMLPGPAVQASPGSPVPLPPASTPNAVPPTVGPPPTPTPSPEPRGRHRAAPKASPSGGPSPTPTPTSPAFATLDGTWEVQEQYLDRTIYSYLDLKQTPTGELSGRWRWKNGKLFPLEGSYDGRNFKMVVKGPDGDYNFSGFVEAASDMIGLIDDGKGKDPVPFTAEHRAPPARGLLKKGEGALPGGGAH